MDSDLDMMDANVDQPPPIRTIPHRVSAMMLDMIHHGDLTMEEAMRFLYPEEAEKIYSLDRWPWGPPEN
ncbi:MAG TPA: hypothetical protein VN666_21720 [Nitrospira sp.]|nr:hypothetical protein [Nitrospira sp.]